MSALTLTLDPGAVGPLDLGGVTPDALAALPAQRRARLRIACGSRHRALGDLFEISGDDPMHLRMLGLNPACHRVGRGMTAGTLEVKGSVGAECGREMRGGTLDVGGDAGAGAALGMRGGVLRVRGDVGASLGGPLPGATAGMNGGVVVVGGNAGARAGERMRRGLLLIAGDCAECAGDRMIAGTIVVFGRCGDLPGLGMRRGSVLLATPPTAMAPTFNDCGEFALGFLPVLAREIADVQPALGRRFARFLRCQRWCGDVAFGGKGEILIASAA